MPWNEVGRKKTEKSVTLQRLAEALGRRANHRLEQARPATREGLRGDHGIRPRPAAHCAGVPAHAKAREALTSGGLISSRALRVSMNTVIIETQHWPEIQGPQTRQEKPDIHRTGG